MIVGKNYIFKGLKTLFFKMSLINFTDQEITGMGGMQTIRGYRDSRFIDNVAAGGNIELRYTFYSFTFKKQHFALMLVPFFDTGSVFGQVTDTNFDNWKYSYGTSFRIAWNLATIIYFDFGFSNESFGFYMNVRQLF